VQPAWQTSVYEPAELVVAIRRITSRSLRSVVHQSTVKWYTLRLKKHRLPSRQVIVKVWHCFVIKNWQSRCNFCKLLRL